MKRFTNEEPFKPFNVTAEWLFARIDGARRCWIRGKFFYMRDNEGTQPGAVWAIRKYRYLGKLQTHYMFRIMALD
jgi:hypothetical protein